MKEKVNPQSDEGSTLLLRCSFLVPTDIWVLWAVSRDSLGSILKNGPKRFNPCPKSGRSSPGVRRVSGELGKEPSLLALSPAVRGSSFFFARGGVEHFSRGFGGVLARSFPRQLGKSAEDSSAGEFGLIPCQG